MSGRMRVAENKTHRPIYAFHCIAHTLVLWPTAATVLAIMQRALHAATKSVTCSNKALHAALARIPELNGSGAFLRLLRLYNVTNNEPCCMHTPLHRFRGATGVLGSRGCVHVLLPCAAFCSLASKPIVASSAYAFPTSALPLLWDGDASAQATQVNLQNANALISLVFGAPTEPIGTVRVCGRSATAGKNGSVTVTMSTTEADYARVFMTVTMPLTAPSGCSQQLKLYKYIVPPPASQTPFTPSVTAMLIGGVSNVWITEVELCPVSGR